MSSQNSVAVLAFSLNAAYTRLKLASCRVIVQIDLTQNRSCLFRDCQKLNKYRMGGTAEGTHVAYKAVVSDSDMCPYDGNK